MIIKNEGYEEKEKQELFKKLKKIGKLFGLNLKIDEDTRDMNSSAEIGKDKIKIGLNYKGMRSKELFYRIRNNIDDFNTSITKEDYQNIPIVLHIFLHEASHLLTMNSKDVERYWNTMIIRGLYPFCPPDEYRKLPYEKLADNLAYELLCKNYDSIIKILLDKRVRIDKRRVSKNKELAKDMKKKYITDWYY